MRRSTREAGIEPSLLLSQVSKRRRVDQKASTHRPATCAIGATASQMANRRLGPADPLPEVHRDGAGRNVDEVEQRTTT
jgi:hypothetical protein